VTDPTAPPADWMDAMGETVAPAICEGGFADVRHLADLAKREGSSVTDYHRARWVVARSQGQVAGCACLWHPTNRKRGLRTSGNYVLPVFRGRGLNSAKIGRAHV